jgi:acetylornithine deacetylase/succinyl-diaminopimelate desuccinylase-like protein
MCARRRIAFAIALACASPLHAAGPPADPLERLRAYLRIDTTNPPGNEKAGATFLRSILDAAGIPSELLELAPGRAALYARLKGGREPGLMLHHHIDVVPANERAGGWEARPFSGDVVLGRLVGRGVLDDKSLGIAQLEAFLALRGKALSRDVVYLATPDEETGGVLGVAAVHARKPEWFAGVGFAIGEGGETETVTDKQRLFGIEVTQKSALWIRITATGTGGHAAAPTPDSAADRLARALGRIEAWSRPLKVEPIVAASAAAQARLKPELLAAPLRDLARLAASDPERLRRSLPPRDLTLISDTIAVTKLATDSAATNVLPTTAVAELDCRLLPSTTPETFLAELNRVLDDPRLRVEVLLDARGGAPSAQGPLYRSIAAVLHERFPAATVVATLSPGISENRVLRSYGIETYGLLPFRVNVYDLAGIHAANERIRSDWFVEGVETTKRIVAAFAAR